MRVLQVDPSAYTPPYDHALCSALADAGAEVTLATSRFAYGELPPPAGYGRDERAFYRWAPGAPGSRARLAAKLAQHVPDMLRLRRRALAYDVVHFQWLAVQHLDAALLPHNRPPTVLTAHDVLPREQRAPGQRAAQRRLYERVDAVVVHSRHGRDRLVAEAGVEPGKIEVIPHGAFTHLASLEPAPLPLPDTPQPVVLFFGLLRPYKGLDVLLDAWRGIDDAQLWVVGQARMDTTALRTARALKLDVIPYLRMLANDPSAQVRRQCAIALRHHPSPEAPKLWTQLALQHDGKDRWYLEALGIGADKQWDTFFDAWLAKVGDQWNTPAGRDIVWRSRSSKTPALLVKIINDKNINNKERGHYFRSLDFIAGPQKDAAMADLALSGVK